MAKAAFPIIEKQAERVRQLANMLACRKLAHALLITGPAGSGQVDMARYLAASLFCEKGHLPCGECTPCRQILAENFVGVLEIHPSGTSMKIDQIRELKSQLALSSMSGPNKVYMIHEADRMTPAAQNSLLKLMEEPTPGVHLMLLTARAENLLATIHSRCQRLELCPLAREMIVTELQAAGIDSTLAQTLAALTADQEEAKSLADSESFKGQMHEALPWLMAILADNSKALIAVVKTWLTLTTDRRENERLLDLLLLYLRDILFLKQNKRAGQAINSEALKLPYLANKYEQLAQTVSDKTLEAVLAAVLKAKAMLQSNVSIQAILEYIVISTWN